MADRDELIDRLVIGLGIEQSDAEAIVDGEGDLGGGRLIAIIEQQRFAWLGDAVAFNGHGHADVVLHEAGGGSGDRNAAERFFAEPLFRIVTPDPGEEQ